LGSGKERDKNDLSFLGVCRVIRRRKEGRESIPTKNTQIESQLKKVIHLSTVISLSRTGN